MRKFTIPQHNISYGIMPRFSHQEDTVKTVLFLLFALCFNTFAQSFPYYAADVAVLREARSAPLGENGYEALYALEKVADTWPEALPMCKKRQHDCLQQAQTHLKENAPMNDDARQTMLALHRAIAALSAYGHFRTPDARYSLTELLPDYGLPLRHSSFHAYRFAEGDRDGALAAVCADIALGKTFIASEDTILQSVVGAEIIARNVILYAHMRAALPRDHALPPVCTAITALDAEQTALCPVLYGEWTALHHDLQAQLTSDDRTIVRQTHEMLADSARYYRSYCSTDARAHIAADILPVIPYTSTCSADNPLCARGPDHDYYQARLLNANRWLHAFVALAQATSPVALALHPEREDEHGTQTFTLPHPGSQIP